MKEVKYYLDGREISFEELSKKPIFITDRENNTFTEMKLNYIDKDAIYFYYQTESIPALKEDEFYEEV